MSENNEQLNTRKFIFYFTFFLISLSVSAMLFLPMTLTGGTEKQLFLFGVSLIPTVVLFVTVKSFLR